jgi:Phasin protein
LLICIFDNRRGRIFVMLQADTAKLSSVSELPAAGAEIREIYQPMVEGMTEFGGALCDAYSAMGSEWIGFVNRRLHSDFLLAGKLAKCGTPQELLGEWSAFMTTAAADYRNELSRIAEMNAAASQHAISAIHANGGTMPAWPQAKS